MKNYKLKDITDVITCGVAKRPQYVDNGVMFLSSQNVKSDKIILSKYNMISEEDYEKLTKINKPEKGDILYTRVGSFGEAAVVDFDEKFAVYVSLTLIKPKKDLINNRYLMHYLNSPKVKEYAMNNTRGIGVQNLNVDTVRDFDIILPDLKTQKKIVEVLDKAQELIDKRKLQIEALDELVKSRFIEMFGDPVNNPKEWNKVNIGSKFEIKTGSTPSRKENTYWENGTIPWVKTTELKEVIINETEEYITQDGYDNSSVNLLPKETLLIAMYGQGKTRGMTGKLGIEATTNQACAAILPNSEENMDFLWYQLKLSYEDLRSLGRGGSQPNLNTNLIKSYELIFPPMKLQNQFVNFVNQVDKLKSQMETSLKELEDNFNSLMQKAFKGELF